MTSSYAIPASVKEHVSDWSDLLYEDEGYQNPKHPTVGMRLGVCKFKHTGIGTWVRTLNLKHKKAVEPRKGSNSKFKSWCCTALQCNWYLSIGRRGTKDDDDW
jgi:hypothetical protein